MKRRFTKYPSNYVSASKKSPNTGKYYDRLWDIVDTLSEYHPDLTPSEDDTQDDLAEKFIYWATEYNDNYFGGYLDTADKGFRKYILDQYAWLVGEPYEE